MHVHTHAHRFRPNSYRQTVELVDHLSVGLEIFVVMADVDEHLKQLSRKQLLEHAAVTLHAEEEAKGAECIHLEQLDR